MVRRVGRHLRRKCDTREIEIIATWLEVGDRTRAVRYNSPTAAGGVSAGRSKSTAGARKKWTKVDGPPLATNQIDIAVVVAAAAAGAIVGDGIGYTIGRRFGMPLLRKYGRYIRLDENRLLIGRYLFFRYGSAVVFFGRFIAVLRMFAALLAGANSMPAGRFFFFNVTGGICWACLFGFGAHAVGTEIFRISKTLSLVSLGLFIGAGSALSIIIRRYEIVLLRQAERALPDR